MTMPALHNCPHADSGWCLECVKALKAENDQLQSYIADRVLMTPEEIADIERVRTLNAEMLEALSSDQSGRSLPELLWVAAYSLDGIGGGPLADCLRASSHKFSAIIAKAKNA